MIPENDKRESLGTATLAWEGVVGRTAPSLSTATSSSEAFYAARQTSEQDLLSSISSHEKWIQGGWAKLVCLGFSSEPSFALAKSIQRAWLSLQ